MYFTRTMTKTVVLMKNLHRTLLKHHTRKHTHLHKLHIITHALTNFTAVLSLQRRGHRQAVRGQRSEEPWLT